MKLSSKVLTSMLLMTAVGVGIAGAQDINAASSTSIGPQVQGALMRMHDLKDKINNLSADVKAQLKAARDAGDLVKVKSILQANGINMPKPGKGMGKRMNGKGKRMEKKGRTFDLKNLPADVRAELKAAFEAKDMAKVKSILAANGIGHKTVTTSTTSTAQ